MSSHPIRQISIWEMQGSRGTAVSDRADELRAAALGFVVRFFDTRDALEDDIGNAEIVATLGLSNEALQRAGKLQWLHDWGAGVDKVMFPELLKHPVVMTCTKGSGGIPMAEWAMMLMLMWSKSAPHYLQASRDRLWARKSHRELNGMTVGIIGLGHSGADLAQKCKAFHMRVLGMRRSNQPCRYVDELFTAENIQELLNQSDFVVVTTPLTPETKGMIGTRELQAMKPESYLIVTSRGGIVDDSALIQALHEERIAGAGLDAHSVEPLPADSPFWGLSNTFISPHCSAIGQGLGVRGAEIFIENVRRYASGAPLMNVVDKQAGY